MIFRDLDLKTEYDSIADDVYADFFNKILKSSKQYSRVGGKFTSRNFAACAEGLQEFIQKDGLMKLVLMPEFSVEDIDSINRGMKKTHEVLSERWIKDFSEIKEKFIDDHVKALAWMLAHGNLEIRLVVPVRNDGTIIPNAEMQASQIFKRKTGIFWDENNEAISFSGNIDFDDKIFGEYYYFRVYRGWDSSEKNYLDRDYEEFHRYWDGEDGMEMLLKIMPLPDAIKNNLIKIAPKSKSEIKLENMPRLRPYQKEAVHNWIGNENHGIFEMATGTGKTFTAIGCIDEIKKKNDNMIVIIACPFDNLERQWQKELTKWGFDSIITSGNTKWSQSMKDLLASLELDNSINVAIIITTYTTFCTNKFIKIIEDCDIPIMLIADEVHNAGSINHLNGLTSAYDYRLGLSATLERYFDPEGTNKLQRFFGNTVYNLNLENAIKQGFLIGYNYYPIYVDLNEEEYGKYSSLTRIIARLWESKDPADREQLERALLNRSRIIRDAENKIEEFEKWVKKHEDDIKYSLVYCSEVQMKRIKNILNQEGITNHEITANIPSNPIQRVEIIKQFTVGRYDSIVANRVLDEGADIPAARNCIMLASTGNPKQFIQRRGRVLRKFKDRYRDGSKKEHANIYDVLVIPDISADYTEDEISLERQIVSSQLRRQEEMANVALNRDFCMGEISRLKEKFSIGGDD